MKKVTVRVTSGLGNQLHCYAFGRAVAAHNGAILELDCESDYWSDPYGRQYLLDVFPNLRFRKKKIPNDRFGRLFFKAWLRLGAQVGRVLPLSLRPVIVEERPLHYQEEVHHTRYKAQPYFRGYWASYRYYHEIAETLRGEMAPPIPREAAVLNVLEQIRARPSCSIHFRSYAEVSGMSPPSMAEYYRSAADLVAREHTGVRFFVFSDNHTAARRELTALAGRAVFVELRDSQGNLQSLNDFYLMYSCDHSIVGNSTFSWWAAWIGEREGKSIVAPARPLPWGADWLPPGWHTLGADGRPFPIHSQPRSIACLIT